MPIKPRNTLYQVAFSTVFLVSSQLSLAGSSVSGDISTLTLEKVESIALENEPGMTSFSWKAHSLSENATAESQLPDPKLQFGILNIPTDSYELDQENMTQIKVGISQRFPAGKTLDIKQKKSEKHAQVFDDKKEEKRLSILKNVRKIYLEIYYLEHAKSIISENRKLFAQLVNIVKSLFSVGKNNQQDLIHAQLQLTKIDDRIVKIDQKIKSHRYQLARWIGLKNSQLALNSILPDWNEINQYEAAQQSFDNLSVLLRKHPSVKEMDNKIDVSRQDIQLVKESYKPGWNLNASYAYREDRPDGLERDDLISIGLSIDLPLFSAKRQDKKLLSKEYEYQSLKDKKLELIRNMVSVLQQEYSNKNQLEKRKSLYQSLVLPQARQQAEAALLAYQSDRGDFSNVMRAYIDNLDVELDDMRITINLLKTKSNILYFVSSFSKEA